MRTLGIVSVMVIVVYHQTVFAAPVTDQLRPARQGAVVLECWLGSRLDLCLANRVMSQDIWRIIGPYAERTEHNAGHWRCEYWGKWVTSAVLGYDYTQSDSHRKVLDKALRELLATQTADGYIGTYRDDSHLGIWDVWGRKYTLLGLLAIYDSTENQIALEAARRVADHLISEAPPNQVNLAENGIDVLQGLSSSSILEPMALLYQRTGDARYLSFAETIVANWSKANRLSPTGPRLMEHASMGTPPQKISSRKAYEMMSCFEGLCELYRITGDKKYLESVEAFADRVRETEIMVHGSGSNQELWGGTTQTQTETLEQPVETCVTVTWMKLCYQLLRLTGESRWADELEVSLYNALLGSMTPDGRWWAYFSPLGGQRVPSHYQHDDIQLSCCVANGPRGLLLTPKWAVMQAADGIVINLYCAGKAECTLPNGDKVTIHQQTDYPAGAEIRLDLTLDKPSRFALRLRIPAWSQRTSCQVNGDNVDCEAGSYANIERQWKAGDTVVLKLDMRGRARPAPSGAPQLAVMRGPIVLALDNRLNESKDIAVRLHTDENGFVDLVPRQDKPESVWLAFDAPFDVRPSHYFEHHQIRLILCDFTSAGNEWSSDNLYRVWLPQPLFMRTPYPMETWRLLSPGLDACPRIPEQTSTSSTSPAKTDRAMSGETIQPAGTWRVAVLEPPVNKLQRPLKHVLEIVPPQNVQVTELELASLPEWNQDQPGWARQRLPCLVDDDCSARFALCPDSIVIRPAGVKHSVPYEEGKDFVVDCEWGTVGRLETGRIAAKQPVTISCSYALRRLDSVVRTAVGKYVVRTGKPHIATPHAPPVSPEELRVANVWLPAHTSQLDETNLFPVMEKTFREPETADRRVAEQLLPKTLGKLCSGDRLKVIAWGDSVTEGYLGQDQWQMQFVDRLKARFPRATIDLVTVGWGAHDSSDFLAAPPGHPRNFAETLLAAQPDLVVSEFVNDCPLDPDAVRQQYEMVKQEFDAIGTEWIILTPHYTTFMGLPSEKNVSEDPRPYVAMVREFALLHDVALADASSRYGHLWRQGIPFSTLLVNTANHPDVRGMKIFADALMDLFPESSLISERSR